jgi:hypothetical protein
VERAGGQGGQDGHAGSGAFSTVAQAESSAQNAGTNSGKRHGIWLFVIVKLTPV